jgi:hypothetical protein
MLETTVETRVVIDDTCVIVRVIAGVEDSGEEMLVEDDGATKVIVFETVIDFVIVDADSVVVLIAVLACINSEVRPTEATAVTSVIKTSKIAVRTFFEIPLLLSTNLGICNQFQMVCCYLRIHRSDSGQTERPAKEKKMKT